MLDGRLRVGVERGTAPAAAAVRRTGVTPDQLTALGLLLAGAAGAAIAVGDLIAGAVLIGFCGLADLLDGPVAKAGGSASLRGAFFDSVADRLSDIFLLAGVAWYLGSLHRPHLAVLALGVLAASMLPSYVRAKADTLGLTARGGIMERAERMIVLGVAIFIQAFVSVPVLVPALWLILALSLLTAVQRFLSGWRQASAKLSAAPSPPRPRPTGARRARREGSRHSVDGAHLSGGPVPHAGELGGRWGVQRAHRLSASQRPARPTRPGSRRHGWGGSAGGDPSA